MRERDHRCASYMTRGTYSPEVPGQEKAKPGHRRILRTEIAARGFEMIALHIFIVSTSPARPKCR